MIDFDPETHTYRVRGVLVPHVTGILTPLERYYGVPSGALEYASERGRDVHSACEYLDQDDLDPASLDEEIAPYVTAYERFLDDARPEWEAIESWVWSERYGYAGTLDRVGVLHGLKRTPAAVIDIKTVSALSPVTGLQLAAYEHAYREMRGRGAARRLARYALQLRPDSTYRLAQYAEPTDYSVFLAQLSVAGWCRRHGKTQEISDDDR